MANLVCSLLLVLCAVVSASYLAMYSTGDLPIDGFPLDAIISTSRIACILICAGGCLLPIVQGAFNLSGGKPAAVACICISAPYLIVLFVLRGAKLAHRRAFDEHELWLLQRVFGEPDNGEVRLLLGEFALRAGDAHRARRWFRVAERLSPDDPALSNRIDELKAECEAT
jgi:hypothetical protein